MPTQLVEEHEVLEIPAFQDYVTQVQQGHGDDANTLGTCCATYIHDLEHNLPQAIVLDSILPCWDWLFSAECADEVILRFSEFLYTQLAWFNPVLIIIEGDVSLALSRAVANRGMAWALNLAEGRTGIRDTIALQDYFARLRIGTETCVPSWPYPVIRVNTVEQSLEQCLLKIMNVIC